MTEGDYISINESPPTAYTESGFLIVSVYTARGAIPIRNALVTISYVDASQSAPYAVLTTDRSGKTPKIALPAPPRDLSLTPQNGGEITLPYSVYNIEIVKEGFYPVVDTGVPIFSGVTAIQSADLIPLSEDLPTAFYRDGAFYVNAEGGYKL